MKRPEINVSGFFCGLCNFFSENERYLRKKIYLYNKYVIASAHIKEKLMKKLFLTFVLAAFASSAVWAEDMPKKPSFAGFVSNGFWDNWEVSAGAGVGTAMSNNGNIGAKSKRIGFEGNFSLTKWIHPVVGLRGQLQGGKLINFDPSLGKLSWPYMFAHGDLMINFSNWVGGYRADRAYYAVPFVGMGYMASNFTDSSKADSHTGARDNFAFAYGLLNKFRLSPSFDFNIELKGFLVQSRMSPARLNGSYLFGLSATVGVTYRFNKRGFERGVAGYTAKDIRAFQEAVASGNAALEASQVENARLNNQLKAAKAEAEDAAAKAAAAKAAAKAAAEARMVKAASPASVILYDYSMSKISPKEKTRLELMADLIKSGPKDRVYTIEGHADLQTGTPAGNKRVAENRAKNVYDYLVKLGVNPNQLTYQGKGDSDGPFKAVQKANRAVVIK